MPTLLQLDSSADLAHSRSRALTTRFAEAWRSRGDDYVVVHRDLHVDPIPHLRTTGQHWPERLREGVEVPSELDALQRTVLDELLTADAVVIGAPMYNFSMPSTLKAWVDLVHVPGITAAFDEETLPLAGKPVVVVSARGATYDAGSPTEHWDHGTESLRLVLGESMKMNVEVVATSRTLADRIPALGAEQAQAEFDAAAARVTELATTL